MGKFICFLIILVVAIISFCLHVDWKLTGPIQLRFMTIPRERRVTVTEVIQGDAIRIRGGKILRLIGIDCPPFEPGTIDFYVQGGESINLDHLNQFEKEAREFAAELVLNKEIRFEIENQDFDKENPLSGYAYLVYDANKVPDNEAYCFLKDDEYTRTNFVNATLVKAGYALPLPFDAAAADTPWLKLLTPMYQEARQMKRGLWGKFPLRMVGISEKPV